MCASMPVCQDIRQHGVKMSKIQDFRMSRYQDFKKSGCQDDRMSGFRGESKS